MAKVYITEYTKIGAGFGFGTGQALVQEPGHVIQTPVAIGGASVQSAAFNADTRIIRVHTDAVCSIAFGTNPTATANSMRLAGNQTEYFAVRAGDKLAVITNT